MTDRSSIAPASSAPELPVGVVIPVYNEGANIRSTLEGLYAAVDEPLTVFVVYDRDDDDTLPPVRELQASLPGLTLLRNRFGRGALNAIRTGLEAVERGVAVVMMADHSDDPHTLPRMIEAARTGAMVVCASRYARGGRQIGGPKLKGGLSRLAGLSLHWLAGLPTVDPTNSYKAYRTELLRAVTIESDGGFEVGIELVVKAHRLGMRIAEVPTVSNADRPTGTSRFQLWKWLPKYGRWYLYALRGRVASILNVGS